MRTPLRARLVAGAAALMVMTTTAVAGAQETSRPPAIERLAVACARIPLIESRIQGLLGRWEADADIRGSLAWLEARAAEARNQGRTERAELIEATIRVRTERIDVLRARLDRLAELADVCVVEGV